jgi:hypothetical protein
LGKPPHFDGKDYPKWAYDMQMHLYGLHPSLWKIVVVGVTIPAEVEALTIEHEQDLHRNVQATRVIKGSLCEQEFNKVRNIQIAKVIWDTLKEAHEGTEHVRQGRMYLINGELELFFMKDGETVQEMYDRLMVLVLDIRALGSKDWDDSKVTKKLLRTFAPKDKNLTAMIRRDPRYPTMTPTQLLGEILHQELVDQDVEKSLTLKMGKSLALNASSSEVVEAKPKPSKSKKEDTSDEGSTDEETTFMDTLLPSAPKTRTRMRKRRNSRRGARNTRTSTNGGHTWVNNGTQVMKMRNQRSKTWQPLPWHKGHLHHASSTTSPMMKTTPTFASWQGGARYKNLPSHLLQSPLHPYLVMT